MDPAELEIFFSSQWTTAVRKWSTSLDSDDLDMVESFKSWQDVQNRVLGSVSPAIAIIRPALSHLSHFANFFETRLGPGLDASFLWGTLACLLPLAAEDIETLGKLPRMVKSLAHMTEAFNSYCDEVQIAINAVREACFDMQILLVEFFTSTINHIHRAGEHLSQHEGSPHYQESGSPVQLIERSFATANHEIRDTLARIKTLVRINLPTRVQSPPNRTSPTSEFKLRCIMMPQTKLTRFFDRVDVFEKLDQILGLAAGKEPFQSVALHGLGGVGKSAIASKYIETKFEEGSYDVILWAHGETPSSLRQSFTDIALRLMLAGAQPQTHDENLILVRDWFQFTDCQWLIVYDNVDSFNMLMPYWPSPCQGRAIITSRSHKLALEPAFSGLEITSWDAKTGSQFLLFLLKGSIGSDLEAECESALALSERLSGHALAISHMAGLIFTGESSIQEFTIMYLTNPRRAHSTNELAALWNFSFETLEKESLSLLGIMSFLMPDIIPQELFEVGPNQTHLEDFEFCRDSFSFSAAIRSLISLALIKRNRDTRVLSIHRMVQTQFKTFLSREQRQKSFDTTVTLVYNAFPREDVAKGQLYYVWETCNRYLQHVLNLQDCFMEEMEMSKPFQAPWKFCEVLIQCQRYLYEANALTDLEHLCDVSLVAVNTLEDGPQKDDLKATIMSHQANLAESLGQAEKAIDLNKIVYEIRLQEKPIKQVLLCYVSNNLGYCHNTANDHKTSLEWFQKARSWWAALLVSQVEACDCPPFILKNVARCMVYLNDLQGAQEMLIISITQLKQVKPLNWAMLAYAYFVQGTLERRQQRLEAAEASFIEAQNSWLKGDQTRLHPFNGGCLYRIGACCLDQGKMEAAIRHIRDSMEVTTFHRHIMPVEHARNLFKLSEMLRQGTHDDIASEADALRDEAEKCLRKARSTVTACNTEDAYDNFIPIFWR